MVVAAVSALPEARNLNLFANFAGSRFKMPLNPAECSDSNRPAASGGLVRLTCGEKTPAPIHTHWKVY
jgi:hypothetical protein